MSRVWNEQLKRWTTYPYDLPDQYDFQWSAIFNINRCIACQTCTMACKSTWTFGKGQEHMWWNNVSTKPYGDHPRGFDAKLLSMLPKGKTIFEAAPEGERVLGYIPDDVDYDYPNAFEDSTCGPHIGAGQYQEIDVSKHKTQDKQWFFYLQRICNHCKKPACLAACPRKAIYKRKEDGIVLIDQERCRGYKKCIMACPYKKTFYNTYTKTSQKCIGCYPRVEQGETTRCIAACIGKIRLLGNIEDEKSPIHYLVHKAKVALPLYPQFGTEPQIYYIPPRWVNTKFLAMMFGNYDEAKIKHAVKTYMNARHDVELLGVLQLFGTTQQIIGSYEIINRGNPKEAKVRAFDLKGQELFVVPIYPKVEVHLTRDEQLNITDNKELASLDIRRDANVPWRNQY
ncbi:MAG: dehydrogenase [Candidatus Obscuribacterales bacterium]|nr:dehydrogenase [Candidatus Obscuribacterales bacterium]